MLHMRAAKRSDEDVLQAIRARFPGLSRQLQRGARFLVDHPDDVALASMRRIAGQARVQPATLVRLAQALGFAGWPALRQRFIDRLRAEPRPFSPRAAALAGRGDPAGLFSETFAMLGANLARMGAAADPRAIDAVAAALERAGTIYVAGFRSCYGPAFGFAYACRLFRPARVVLLNAIGGAFDAELRSIARGDAAVVIGFAPYSREAAQVTEIARRAGAAVVAVTDSTVSPLAEGADHLLLFSTGSPSFFPSVVTAAATLEALAAVLAARSGSRAVAAVRAAEAQLYDLGAYLPQKKGVRP